MERRLLAVEKVLPEDRILPADRIVQRVGAGVAPMAVETVLNGKRPSRP